MISLLDIQINGYSFDTAFFIFLLMTGGGLTWWLIAMYNNVHYLKRTAKERGRRQDIANIKLDCVAETLGTDDIEFGKKFRDEFKNNMNIALKKYEAENPDTVEIEQK